MYIPAGRVSSSGRGGEGGDHEKWVGGEYAKVKGALGLILGEFYYLQTLSGTFFEEEKNASGLILCHVAKILIDFF